MLESHHKKHYKITPKIQSSIFFQTVKCLNVQMAAVLYKPFNSITIQWFKYTLNAYEN